VRKWYQEDWRFRIVVLRVGEQDRAEDCRLGFERGGAFECAYECPPGFCPKALLKVFPLMEAVRSGGDLRNLGGAGPAEIETVCPDGVVRFRLTGRLIASSDG
jgi:uncharacterized repeat protein (TIGR04076 family)